MRDKLKLRKLIATALLIVSVSGFVVSMVTIKQNRINFNNREEELRNRIGDDDYYSFPAEESRAHEKKNQETKEIQNFFTACFACGVVSTVALGLFISSVYKEVYTKKVTLK